MIERILLSALTMGSLSFLQFYSMINSGLDLMAAQNITLLLMVLFENVMVGNCRSEKKSAFFLNPLNNPILFIGTLIAQAVHIGAMYTPGLKDLLGLSPVDMNTWLSLLTVALSV